MLWFISEQFLICGFELFIEEFLRIPMENMNGENTSWNILENRAGGGYTVQAVDVSWPSFNAALCGRVQALLQAAVSSASIAVRSPSPSFSGTLTLSFLCSFWVLLSVSLVWLRLKALSVVLSEVCPRLARAQSFSDLFRHIQFTQAQCAVKAMILIQEKREKSLSFSSL